MQALVFPGQGSQFVGMGKALYDEFTAARAVFEEVDDTLSQALSQLMFEGPEDTLTLTENTQPALMTVSMALVKVLEVEFGLSVPDVCHFVAGHSLGEYTALAAAGSLTLSDTARLLRIRGRAMQSAVPVGQGAMAAILGLELDQVEKLVSEVSTKDTCTIANDNCVGQVVISGTASAITQACDTAKKMGAKRALPLNVSAPFHCSLMEPAAHAMAEALATVSIIPPSRPLVANVIASAIQNTDEIQTLLVQQVTGRVRWRESVQWMHQQGVTSFIEMGAGKVLAGLCQRSVPGVSVLSLQTPQDLQTFVEERKVA